MRDGDRPEAGPTRPAEDVERLRQPPHVQQHHGPESSQAESCVPTRGRAACLGSGASSLFRVVQAKISGGEVKLVWTGDVQVCHGFFHAEQGTVAVEAALKRRAKALLSTPV